jgi:hypothetical protein
VSVRDVLSHSASGARRRSQQAFAQRGRVDEPRERALAVDFHDREPLAVRGLQAGVAVDLDHLETEGQLGSRRLDDLERRLAEVAAAADVDDDARGAQG